MDSALFYPFINQDSLISRFIRKEPCVLINFSIISINDVYVKPSIEEKQFAKPFRIVTVQILELLKYIIMCQVLTYTF